MKSIYDGVNMQKLHKHEASIKWHTSKLVGMSQQSLQVALNGLPSPAFIHRLQNKNLGNDVVIIGMIRKEKDYCVGP